MLTVECTNPWEFFDDKQKSAQVLFNQNTNDYGVLIFPPTCNHTSSWF